MLHTLRSIRKMPHAVILAVLTVALLARLAVPAGWMPVSDANGVRLTICTGTGALDAPDATMAAAMPGMRHMAGDQGRHDNGHGDDHICPYTSAALALTQPTLPDVGLAPFVTHVSAVSRVITVSVGHGLAAPPPPATGPPILV